MSKKIEDYKVGQEFDCTIYEQPWILVKVESDVAVFDITYGFTERLPKKINKVNQWLQDGSLKPK